MGLIEAVAALSIGEGVLRQGPGQRPLIDLDRQAEGVEVVLSLAAAQLIVVGHQADVVAVLE